MCVEIIRIYALNLQTYSVKFYINVVSVVIVEKLPFIDAFSPARKLTQLSFEVKATRNLTFFLFSHMKFPHTFSKRSVQSGYVYIYHTMENFKVFMVTKMNEVMSKLGHFAFKYNFWKSFLPL